MISHNGWPNKFSKVMDAKKYYEEQSSWERDFSVSICDFLDKRQKEIYCDFDCMYVPFTQKKIKK